ncbi:MAG: cystathionine gamma-lyase [Lysobacteraceae bacterium]|nr:MAG: cystathionine gamma-lyase [Xanthomonadaceae bacterium]
MHDLNHLAASLLHLRSADIDQGESLSPPLVNASVFHVSGDPSNAEFQYGRFDSPTWVAVEKQLAHLEDADVITFPSGMAAIAAVLVTNLHKGDRVVIPSDGYLATRSFAQQYLVPLGIDVKECPTADVDQVSLAGVSMLFVETPSNPGLDVCDLVAVTARAKAKGVVVVVDNTTMTPYLQRPLDLGADFSVAADTKAPAGHGDVVFGHVASRDKDAIERISQWRKLSGSIPGPFEAWLVHRGLETLELRLERMCSNAMAIAERLKQHPSVQAIRYPGLSDDPSHAICRRQTNGFGFLIGMTLSSGAHAERFLSRCSLIAETTSFGSVHTSGERRIRWGDNVAEGFVRLSIGCEPLEPLWKAIDDALTR